MELESTTAFKVEFFDNSAYQYDDNAAEIMCLNGNGKLYLGDRFSASFVQLQARNCTTVVSCCQDMHGFAKEENISYLKIDPDYDDDTHFEESCEFIRAALASSECDNNIVVFCESGNCKSAMILCYFLMVHDSISLCEAYDRIRKSRPSVNIFPRLMKLLILAEIGLRGVPSLEIEGRIIRPVSEKCLDTDNDVEPVD